MHRPYSFERELCFDIIVPPPAPNRPLLLLSPSLAHHLNAHTPNSIENSSPASLLHPHTHHFNIHPPYSFERRLCFVLIVPPHPSLSPMSFIYLSHTHTPLVLLSSCPCAPPPLPAHKRSISLLTHTHPTCVFN